MSSTALVSSTLTLIWGPYSPFVHSLAHHLRLGPKWGLSPKTSVLVSLLASNFLPSLQGGAYLPSERGGTGRRDHRKIWKDDLKLLTLKVWNLTSVYLSSWQLPLSYVLPGCPC